jgi:hypothetical protein
MSDLTYTPGTHEPELRCVAGESAVALRQMWATRMRQPPGDQEAMLVLDHRFAERQGRGVVIHAPRADHACPLCRLLLRERQVHALTGDAFA